MRLNISRVLEISQMLATEAGQQLQDLLQYTADFSEQAIRALRNSLNFSDNFDCSVTTVSLQDGVASTVQTSASPVGVFVTRVTSTDHGVDNFAWWIANDGSLTVQVGFTNSPTTALPVTLVILYS